MKNLFLILIILGINLSINKNNNERVSKNNIKKLKIIGFNSIRKLKSNKKNILKLKILLKNNKRNALVKRVKPDNANYFKTDFGNEDEKIFDNNNDFKENEINPFLEEYNKHLSNIFKNSNEVNNNLKETEINPFLEQYNKKFSNIFKDSNEENNNLNEIEMNPIDINEDDKIPSYSDKEDNDNSKEIEINPFNMNEEFTNLNHLNDDNSFDDNNDNFNQIYTFKNHHHFPFSWIHNLFNFKRYLRRPMFHKRPENNKNIFKIFIINHFDNPFHNEINKFMSKLKYLFFKKESNPLKLATVKYNKSKIEPNLIKKSIKNIPMFETKLKPNKKNIILTPFDCNNYDPKKHQIHKFDIKESYIQTNETHKSNTKINLNKKSLNNKNISLEKEKGDLEDDQIIKF